MHSAHTSTTRRQNRHIQDSALCSFMYVPILRFPEDYCWINFTLQKQVLCTPYIFLSELFALRFWPGRSILQQGSKDTFGSDLFRSSCSFCFDVPKRAGSSRPVSSGNVQTRRNRFAWEVRDLVEIQEKLTFQTVLDWFGQITTQTVHHKRRPVASKDRLSRTVQRAVALQSDIHVALHSKSSWNQVYTRPLHRSMMGSHACRSDISVDKEHLRILQVAANTPIPQTVPSVRMRIHRSISEGVLWTGDDDSVRGDWYVVVSWWFVDARSWNLSSPGLQWFCTWLSQCGDRIRGLSARAGACGAFSVVSCFDRCEHATMPTVWSACVLSWFHRRARQQYLFHNRARDCGGQIQGVWTERLVSLAASCVGEQDHDLEGARAVPDYTLDIMEQ